MSCFRVYLQHKCITFFHLTKRIATQLWVHSFIQHSHHGAAVLGSAGRVDPLQTTSEANYILLRL